MIISSSTGEDYVIRLSDGEHVSYADVPEESGGKNQYQRPGDILTSAFAACLNMTIQRILKEKKLSYDKVVIEADFDWSELEENQLDFFYIVDIQGKLTEQQKEEVKAEAKECTVCQYLQAKKVLTEIKK
ncbi:MAG: OsmC family peroxiredoxin [Dorea sp.]|jgi:uncharacterized OsmC-like protein|nr:OsmC family peroxiredoxin [Dorea sp.]